MLSSCKAGREKKGMMLSRETEVYKFIRKKEICGKLFAGNTLQLLLYYNVIL